MERKRWEKRRKEAVLGGGIRCPGEGIRGAFAGHFRGIRFRKRASAPKLVRKHNKTCEFLTWVGLESDTELPYYNIKRGEEVFDGRAHSKILPHAANRVALASTARLFLSRPTR